MLTTVIILTSFAILLIDIVSSNRDGNRPKYLLKLSRKGLILLIAAIIGVSASVGKEYFKFQEQKQQKEFENQQLLRISSRADNAIKYSIQFLSGFLSKEDRKEIFKLFENDFMDEPCTNRPDPSILDPLIELFVHHSWLSSSNMIIEGKNVPWLSGFEWHLIQMHEECDLFLKHYGNVKHPLVNTIDDIRLRAETLLLMIGTCLKKHEYQNQFIELYRNGIPKVHIEFYRHFYLRIIKAKRLIREIQHQNI